MVLGSSPVAIICMYYIYYILSRLYPSILLTSVFHERLSFMAVGHNPTCISTLAPCSWGFIWGAVTPLVESRGNALESFGYFTHPMFSDSLRKTRMVTSSPHNHILNGNTKWQVIWTYHNFFSMPHAHAIFYQPKGC